MQKNRTYPVLSQWKCIKARNLSFVTIHFCDDYLHNILRSKVLRDPRHEFITIDNRSNLKYDNLGQAINVGIAASKHDIVVVVHEDVVLPDGWDGRFEAALSALETADPDWALLGIFGWKHNNEGVGNVSDPHGYTVKLPDREFEQVARIDEQLMVFRKSADLRADENLPSIHFIGVDLARSSEKMGRKTYVVNAPCIHKFADALGRKIISKENSPKIVNRKSLTFQAEYNYAKEYLDRKWDSGAKSSIDNFDNRESLAPIIFLARGGSGSRLVANLAKDCSIQMGSNLNISGDCLDMVLPVYQSIFRYFRGDKTRQDTLLSRKQLSDGAEILRQQVQPEGQWGFKLPESILIGPTLLSAFPNAKFVHLIRDPLSTCLRRTHMTARLDNEIGRITLPQAYDYFGVRREQILSDAPAIHMAYTTMHQIQLAMELKSLVRPTHFFELRFEDICSQPGSVLSQFSKWLDSPLQSDSLSKAIDPQRVAKPSVSYDQATTLRVTELLAPLRRRLGYL